MFIYPVNTQLQPNIVKWRSINFHTVGSLSQLRNTLENMYEAIWFFVYA